MIIEMNLNPRPFELMKTGKKRVELRLYDEKRRRMQVGEYVHFTNVQTGELLKMRIVAIQTFSDFFALYECFDKIKIGYEEGEQAKPEDMYAYYSKEEISRYGVVGISVEE